MLMSSKEKLLIVSSTPTVEVTLGCKKDGFDPMVMCHTDGHIMRPLASESDDDHTIKAAYGVSDPIVTISGNSSKTIKITRYDIACQGKDENPKIKSRVLWEGALEEFQKFGGHSFSKAVNLLTSKDECYHCKVIADNIDA